MTESHTFGREVVEDPETERCKDSRMIVVEKSLMEEVRRLRKQVDRLTDANISMADSLARLGEQRAFPARMPPGLYRTPILPDDWGLECEISNDGMEWSKAYLTGYTRDEIATGFCWDVVLDSDSDSSCCKYCRIMVGQEVWQPTSLKT